jgi:hypothetical protein
MNIIIEFISSNNLMGVSIGLCTFFIIGIFHPIVIKGEYFFGTKIWYIFLIFGIAGIITAVYIKNIFFSTIVGVTAFSCFWSILEIFEQKKRVEKGWFPKRSKKID